MSGARFSIPPLIPAWLWPRRPFHPPASRTPRGVAAVPPRQLCLPAESPRRAPRRRACALAPRAGQRSCAWARALRLSQRHRLREFIAARGVFSSEWITIFYISQCRGQGVQAPELAFCQSRPFLHLSNIAPCQCRLLVIRLDFPPASSPSCSPLTASSREHASVFGNAL